MRAKINNVVKYQLREVFITVIFFVTVAVIDLYVNEIKDFPLARIIIGTILFSLIVSYYEIVISKKLKKHLILSLYMLVAIVFYYMVFFVMMILLIYVNFVFKFGLTINEALSSNIWEMIPQNLGHTLYYFSLFLVIRFLIMQFQSRNMRGVFGNLLLSQKEEPISTAKIFMFMDLYSSTTFAEKLGYLKYSMFIRDIYSELDEYVLETKGIIYQYVGDEVVVVWSLKDGVQNYNCIRFFLLFEERLHSLKEKFFEKYGVIPKFKAGFHYGTVAISEIGGVLKKDIAFHGDPVNTTARICAKCNEIDEKILISEDLVAKIISSSNESKFRYVGKFNLKGKSEATDLYKLNDSQMNI